MATAGRTVILAVDASEHSKGAFEYYADKIRRPDDVCIICHIPEVPDLPVLSFKRYLSNVNRKDDCVVICHIPEPPKLPMFSLKDGLNIPVEEWQKAIQDQLEKVRKLEEDFEAELITRKIQYKVKGETNKTPGEGIINLAEKENADFIVMGTRGLDLVRRTLLGSVSDYVVRHSRVPVLICPSMQKGDKSE